MTARADYVPDVGIVSLNAKVRIATVMALVVVNA